VEHETIFHELLNSDLPPEEKSDVRLADEAQLVVAAGLITTSCKQHWVLVLVRPDHLRFYLMHSVLLHTLPKEEIRLPKPS
jgi:hypothetical protein